MSVLILALIAKGFAWLLFFGITVQAPENNQLVFESTIKLMHQVSYLITTSLLFIGILARSSFAYIALIIIIIINLILCYLQQYWVYQSITDLALLIIFSIAIYAHKSDPWFKNT